jgi:hypothetical protein
MSMLVGHGGPSGGLLTWYVQIWFCVRLRHLTQPPIQNEFAKQIKEYRAQEKGKAYGKVFVKGMTFHAATWNCKSTEIRHLVLGIRGMYLPLPREPTVVTCTLNNGIHFVTTPECQLSPDCPIEQEFEL